MIAEYTCPDIGSLTPRSPHLGEISAGSLNDSLVELLLIIIKVVPVEPPGTFKEPTSKQPGFRAPSKVF